MYIRFLSFAFLLLFNFSSAYADISVVASSTTNASFGSFGRIDSFTVPAGSDQVLYVTVGYGGGNSVSQVLYDGVQMTFATSSYNGFGGYVDSYYLYNPAVGTHNIDVQSPLVGNFTEGVVLLSGVDTTVPPVIYDFPNNGTPYTTYQKSLNATAGDFGIMGMFAQNASPITAVSGSLVISQPEASLFGTAILSSAIPVTTGNVTITLGFTTSLQLVTSNVLIFHKASSGGGGGGGGSWSDTSTTTVITNNSASFYSSIPVIVNPVTSTTYSFNSSVTDSTKKQGGLVFITHNISVSPTVTWGSSTMTKIIDNNYSDTGYKTTLFYVRSPTSSSTITVSNITSSSTYFISESVWSNANIISSYDESSVVNSPNNSLDISSLTVSPVTEVGVFFTQYPLSYTKMSSTILNDFGSTLMLDQFFSYSTSTFSLISRKCIGYAGLSDCDFGYTPDNFSNPTGHIIGLSLYSTSSSVVVTSTLSGTQEALPKCESLDIGCYISNALRYVFIPNTSTINKFTSLTLASSAPFSYVYDMGNLRDDLFNTSTTTEYALVLPFHTVSSSTASLSLISKQQLEDVPFINIVKTLIGAIMWIALAFTMYNQLLRVHDSNTP